MRRLSGVVALVLAGCSGGGAAGSSGAPAGEERGACFANGTCNHGLSCLSDRCVDRNGAGGTTGTGSGGTAGTGGASAAGAGGTATGGGPGSKWAHCMKSDETVCVAVAVGDALKADQARLDFEVSCRDASDGDVGTPGSGNCPDASSKGPCTSTCTNATGPLEKTQEVVGLGLTWYTSDPNNASVCQFQVSGTPSVCPASVGNGTGGSSSGTGGTSSTGTGGTIGSGAGGTGAGGAGGTSTGGTGAGGAGGTGGCVSSCPSGFTPRGLGCTDDASVGWSGTQNPSGNWMYGSQPSGSTAFSIFGTHTVDRGITLWNGGAVIPTLGFNAGTAPVVLDGSTTWAARQLSLHPGAGGARGVLRWTAPGAGGFALEMGAEGLSGLGASPRTSTTVRLLHGNTELFSQGINVSGGGNTASFSATVAIGGDGETIDVVVEDGGNGYTYDTTGITMTVTVPLCR